MERLDLFERKNFMKNLTKTEKLEKILRKYGMNFDDLRQLNESQIKAVETDYHSTYGKSIAISCFSWSSMYFLMVASFRPTVLT